jgi:hypothetical protein
VPGVSRVRSKQRLCLSLPRAVIKECACRSLVFVSSHDRCVIGFFSVVSSLTNSEAEEENRQPDRAEKRPICNNRDPASRIGISQRITSGAIAGGVHARVVHPNKGASGNSQQDQAQHKSLYPVPFHTSVLAFRSVRSIGLKLLSQRPTAHSGALIVFDLMK